VPDIVAFRGLRYRSAERLDALCAPPYDVIDPDERAALYARSPHNSARLILPEGDDPYAQAATDLVTWERAGVLVRDETPRFYAYRMEYVDEDGRPRHTAGFLGALVLPEAAGAGDVLPHERTLPKAKSDRLSLLRATRANLDPIWGLTPSSGLSAELEGASPLGICTDDHGVRHSIGAIDSVASIAAIRAVVAGAPLVLADGHHRFETAIAYRDERRAAGLVADGDGAVMCLVVELADAELWVQPIHRLYTGGPATGPLRERLAGAFGVFDAGPNTAEGVAALERAVRAEGGVGLVDREGLARLVPAAPALAAARAALEPTLVDVASAWFDELAADTFAGAEATYRNDATTVAALVGKGAADAAVLLPPVTVGQIRAAALAGVRMPQKTTFFAPKPRTGMVFRMLDG